MITNGGSRLAPVSVIIPTRGRPTLVRAVKSVLNQTLPPAEILVVVDNAILNEEAQNFLDSSGVRSLKSEGRGVSAARNAGMFHASGTYIALLDDDDIWAPIKLQRQMEFISRNGLSESSLWIVASKALYFSDSSALPMPRDLYSGSDFLSQTYRTTWKRVRICLPTPTLIFPRALSSEIEFDTELQNREDIWFVHEAEALGAHVLQMPETLVAVSYDGIRSRSRETLVGVFQWGRRLFDVSPKIAISFLLGIGFRSLLLKYVAKVLRL